MSADVGIDAHLLTLGFDLPEGRRRARALLEEAGLTHAGKQRISAAKLARAEEVLRGHLYVHCPAPACRSAAEASGREPLPTATKPACEACGGSENRRAEEALIEAARRHGIRRLVVVGGSPSVREELRRLEGPLELRLVDGTERRTADRARADVEWADLVLIWGASELHHKVSKLYTDVPPPLRRRVVVAQRRGVSALLSEAVAHLERR